MADIFLFPLNPLNARVVNRGPDAATVSVIGHCDSSITIIDGDPAEFTKRGNVLTTVNPIPSGGELDYGFACLPVTAEGYTEVFASDRYDPNSTPNNADPSEDDYISFN